MCAQVNDTHEAQRAKHAMEREDSMTVMAKVAMTVMAIVTLRGKEYADMAGTPMSTDDYPKWRPLREPEYDTASPVPCDGDVLAKLKVAMGIERARGERHE